MGKKILIVEDEYIEALDIKQNLESFGYEVPYIASFAEEAIEKTLELEPDLVLMDIILKGESDGIYAASEIKDSGIPIIYLTAHSEKATVQRALATDPHAYLLKPYDRTELKFAIELAIFKGEMNAKLKESKSKYMALVEQAADPLFVHDFNGKFVEVNKRACESLGYTREELLQMGVFDVEEDFDLESAQKEWAKIEPGSHFILYGHQKRKDGTVFPVEVHFAMAEISGEPLIMGFARDITEREKNEALLKESEQRYRRIGQLISDFAYSCIRNELGAYDLEWITDSFFNMTGFTTKDLDIHKCWMFSVHPEDKEIAHQQLKNLKPGSKNVTNFRILNSTGEVRWLRNHIQCVTDEELDKFRIYGAAQDITELRRTETELQESEEKYRTLFESDPDFMFLLGLDGLVLDINFAAAKFLALSREEAIGKEIAKLGAFPEEDVLSLGKKFICSVKGQCPEKFQYKFYNNQGEYRWVDSRFIPIEKDGQIYSILAIATDITDRKIATDRLETSLKEKDVLLKEINHRVKNNMQIISSLLNLQIQYVEGDDLAVDVLKESQNRVRSMAMIHEKLFGTENFSEIKFNEYIQKIVSDLSYSYHINEEKIKTKIEVDKINLNIETAIPCGLIISELVSNSFKHAFPNGREGEVKIILKKNDIIYELIVSDDGIGFPEELDFKNTNSLGLKLVNILVSQVDGKISMTRNHGTKFKIKFKELKYKERV